MPWVDTETGELATDCPICEQTRQGAEVQMSAMEKELRQKRAKITRLENEREAAEVSKRDGAVWKQIRSAWLAGFPDKKPTSLGIKSERATKVFVRLESGAGVEDVLDAIAGAMQYPFVVYGRRTKTGSVSDLATDLAHIVSVNSDANFDFLRETGHELRSGSTSVT